MHCIVGLLLIFFMGGMVPPSALAAESGWNEAGVRMGFQVNSKEVYFRQYEAFAVYGLPWEWRTVSGWGVAPRVDVSLGVLEGAGQVGLIGALGPALTLDKPDGGFSTDLGINADILERRHFGRQDFGRILQFGAYLGVNYRFASGIKIGYRLQHISNGHILYPKDTPNPGLDMHLFGLSYVF